MSARPIEIKDWSCRHNTLVYTRAMKPLGWVHCEAAVVHLAYNPDSSYLGEFMTHKDAVAALATHNTPTH